jgi:hypothetical protein
MPMMPNQLHQPTPSLSLRSSAVTAELYGWVDPEPVDMTCPHRHGRGERNG